MLPRKIDMFNDWLDAIEKRARRAESFAGQFLWGFVYGFLDIWVYMSVVCTTLYAAAFYGTKIINFFKKR